MVEDAAAVKEDAVEDAVEDADAKGDAVEDAADALVMLMASAVAALAATALDIEVVFVLNESIAVGDVELLRDVLPFRALKIEEKKWSKNAGKDLVEIFCCATDALNSDFVEGETTLLMLLLYYMVEFS